jgi:hypothetical protein
MNRMTIGLFISIGALILTGCVPMQRAPVTPVSYSFVYAVPNTASRSQPVTIAVVRPSVADPTAFAKTPAPHQQIGNAFATSMKADLDKMLVAKGYKVTGPYESINDMTFPEKQAANLTLTPIMDLRVSQQPTSETGTGSPLFPRKEAGMYVVGGWISLVLLEPLTGEKMWIKKIDVEPMQQPYLYEYVVQQYRGQLTFHPVSDNRPQALAAALEHVYPQAMAKAWDYFHPDEILQVKKQADEARRLKRF